MPIQEHGLFKPISVGITYNTEFEMYCALKSARCDLWQYELGIYPPWFLAKLLVHWRMEQLVSTHAEDARARKAWKDSKRKR